MRFRSIILGLAGSLLAQVALAADKPYRVSLLGGGFDGTSWHAGVLITLDPGWKTYWRMPGESGIPPDFSWATSAPARIDVHYPTPRRFRDASGETVGYEDEVLFPVTVTPEAAGAAGALDLSLGLFFAVCKDVCIPAQAEARATLSPTLRDPAGSARVEGAMRAVPVVAPAVTAVALAVEEGKPVLKLTLDRAVDDIFVETSGSAYFRAPRFSSGRRAASLAIDNVGDAAKLSGARLTLTFVTGDAGLEQSLTLP